MLNISAIMAGVGTLEKFIPVVEAVGKEIGPLVQKELADGKVIWGDVTKAWNDFKEAVGSVKDVAVAHASEK